MTTNRLDIRKILIAYSDFVPANTEYDHRLLLAAFDAMKNGATDIMIINIDLKEITHVRIRDQWKGFSRLSPDEKALIFEHASTEFIQTAENGAWIKMTGERQ